MFLSGKPWMMPRKIRWMIRPIPLRTVVGVALLSASICGGVGQTKSQPGSAPVNSVEGHSSNGNPSDGNPGDGYLGSQACSRCHSQIYQQFSQTSMGRSMSVATPAILSTIPSKTSYVSQQLSRRFDVYSAQDKLYQSETGIAADGKESFQSAHQIDWIIGAGLNGFGAIIRKDQYLFQAPLSFYSKPQSWAPSPGYESLDIGFNRPIPAGCIFCHSGRPNSVGENNGKFEPTPFAELPPSDARNVMGPAPHTYRQCKRRAVRLARKTRQLSPSTARSSIPPGLRRTSPTISAWPAIRPAMCEFSSQEKNSRIFARVVCSTNGFRS